MKKLRKDTTKYTILKNLYCDLTSNCDKNHFTRAAMDNFVNSDKNDLSNKSVLDGLHY